MSNEEMEKEIEKIQNAIISEQIKNFADGHGAKERAYSLARIVAEAIVKSGWENQVNFFGFYLDCGFLTFSCANGCGKTEEANISGYNFAYQVKLIFDSIEKSGFFA